MFILNTKRESLLRSKIAAGFFALLFLLCLLPAYQNAFGASALLETQALADSLKQPAISLIYAASPQPNDKAGYDKGHIAGSVYLDINTLMGIMGDGSAAPDKAKFEALMGSMGISNDSQVVVYGSGGANPFITAAFWLMKYNGHKNVSYLNGGLAKWTAEKRPVTGNSAKVSPAKYKAVPDESIRAEAGYVAQNLKNPKVAIVDVRAADEYSGANAMGNKRTGHMPGVVNLSFNTTNLNNDGTFKSADALKAAYEAKGITKDKEVIVYCQGGVRAAHTYFTLKHILGYPKVKNYVGSWGEWSKLDPAKHPAEK